MSLKILLQEFHDSLTSGHTGVLKTYKRIASQFVQEKMKQSIEDDVQQCPMCQRTKYATRSLYILLATLLIPQRICEDLSIDFTICVPKSKGCKVILLVMDRLSKYCHLDTLNSHFIVAKVAQLFTHMMICLHGFPYLSFMIEPSLSRPLLEAFIQIKCHQTHSQQCISPLDRWINGGIK